MIKLLPTPKSINIENAEKTAIKPCIYTSVAKWGEYAEVFINYFELAHGIRLEFAPGGIELCENAGMHENAYTIESKGSVTASASSNDGILYALSSLMQIFTVKDGEISLEELSIHDYPEKDYRAVMVDLGRHWHPFNKLLKFVDICFMYKIKYLNLHFVDNNLYTLPSKKYPKLPSEGKHYTFEEIKELNEYAKKRGVVIVPEYECPGHASVFNRAYPEIFSDTIDNGYSDVIITECGGPIGSEDIICAGSEKCTEATYEILKESCDMFPDSPYIHIGGDEAPVDVWDNCSVCKKYMEENNISGSHELYGEYVGRICKYVLSIGKTPIVWEGFPEESNHYIPKETIVIGWENLYQTTDKLLEAGFKVLNSSWQPLYIVQHYRERWDPRDILKWNVYNWQHWWSKSKAHLNPINVEPTNQVIGAMMCVWEMNYEQEINFMIENILAMSERVWNVDRKVTDAEYFDIQLPLTGMVARIIQDR